ncbi:MAG: hypothetical protein CVV11_10440 [Gammaproteobacteria bacterium HGW-Gammaproteobacteria-15]|nr:MAG: hypothetical protein CVV11_10440 [Gammaproteobacteria bacterium HGW-Gammaproteobacteria-15]
MSPEHFFHNIILRIQKLRNGQFVSTEMEYVALLAVYVVLKMELLTRSSHSLAKLKDQPSVITEVKDLVDVLGYADSTLTIALELIESEPEILAEVFWFFRKIECNSPATFFQECADYVISQSLKRSYFPPSKEVSWMMNNLNPESSSRAILGINFHLTDFTASEIKSGSLRQDVAMYSMCFEPLLHFVNELKSRLVSEGQVNNFLVFPHDTQFGKMPVFDLVIANPPFGANFSGNSKASNGSGEAQFLRKAIDATAKKGKVVFIVPNGFLFKGGTSVAEYQLRKELTDCRAIKSIIELPDSVFMPNAKIRTAILNIDYSNPNDFISMTRFSKKQLGSLKDINATEIHRLVCGEEVEFGAEKLPTVCRVPYSSVIENGYDWQIQTYNDSNPDSFRAIHEIRKEVIDVENQLAEVRHNIDDILHNIRSFL